MPKARTRSILGDNIPAPQDDSASWKRTGRGVWKNVNTGEVRKGQAGNPGRVKNAGGAAPTASAAPNAADQPAYLSDPNISFGFNVADAQRESNLGFASALADINRVNQTGPLGSVTYTTGPDGKPIQTTTLDPWQQKLLQDQAYFDIEKNKMVGPGGGTGIWERMVDAYSSPYDLGGLPKALGTDDLRADRQRVEDEVFNRYKSDLDTRFIQEEQDLQQRLAGMGIPMGSERYREEMDQFSQRKNKAYQDAKTQAMLEGRGETQAMFDMSGAARQRAVGEYQDQRDRPLKEFSQMRGGGPTFPNFGQVPMVDAPYPDIAGPAMEAYRQQQENARLDKQLGAAKGGGGSDGPDWFTQQQFMHDLEKDLISFKNSNAPKPSGGSGLIGLGGTVLQGLAQGVGSGLASGSWFK